MWQFIDQFNLIDEVDRRVYTIGDGDCVGEGGHRIRSIEEGRIPFHRTWLNCAVIGPV